jgi:spore coat protein U-like protein
MRTLAATLLIATLAFAPAIADAATGTGTLAVVASVAANCVVATNAAVDFGTYDTAVHLHDGPVDVTVQAVSIACTKDASGVSIALDQGQYARGPHRGLGGGPGSETVAYDIYTSQERSTVWNGVNTVAYASQSSRAVTIPLYGRIPAGQTVAPGRYSDVLLAMVNF